jgi:hypothetical protein
LSKSRFTAKASSTISWRSMTRERSSAAPAVPCSRRP